MHFSAENNTATLFPSLLGAVLAERTGFDHFLIDIGKGAGVEEVVIAPEVEEEVLHGHDFSVGAAETAEDFGFTVGEVDGLAFYQPTAMALDSHCIALVPKIVMSRYTMLFIAMCISKQRILFGHGRAINASRLRIFRLMLPTDEEGNPDYAYMDKCMRDKEQIMVKQATDILYKRLIDSEITGGVKWNNYFLRDVFPYWYLGNQRASTILPSAIKESVTWERQI